MTLQTVYRDGTDERSNSTNVELNLLSARSIELYRPNSRRYIYRGDLSGTCIIRGDQREVALLKGTSSASETFAHIDFITLSPWRRVERTVSEWWHLEADWDDDEAVAPPRAALAALRAFIERASRENVRVARPYIAGDGEIGLKWDLGERIATVSFLADGRFMAYCPRPKGSAVRVVGDYSAAAIPKDFFEAVRALT